MLRFILALIITLLSTYTALATDTDHPIIPRQVLFGNPEKTAVTISPDGKYIGYYAPKDEILTFWIADINDLSSPRVITNGVRGYSWAFDNKHILYAKDNNGDENFRFYAYDIETRKVTLLTPESGVKMGLYVTTPNKPNELLISLNDRDKRYFDLYKVSLLDYSKKLVFKNNRFFDFVIDNDLNLRLGVSSNKDDGNKEYFQFANNEWTPFMILTQGDTANTSFAGFDKTNTIAYLRDSRGRDTAAIKTLDLQTGKMTTLASNKHNDVYIAARHPTEQNIQVVGINYDKPTYKVLDKSIAKDIKYLHSINTGYFDIRNRTIDDKTWLISYYSDTSTTQYYIYDRTQKKIKFLFGARPELNQYRLIPMKPVVIKSRDGLKMMSYLTLPYNKKTGEAVPMVLSVHGGPHARDTWGLSMLHQWLANRGYAVLSVNYRGSSGFGKKFLTAGYGEWGRKMQDDLIDAVNWAIKHKLADPKRICIGGGSYGGYATLAGLTFTPNIFACGVDTSGISNLVTSMTDMPSYWKSIEGFMKVRIGNPDTPEDRENLKQRSPLTFAHKIKKPLLIAQGANDPRVKQSEADQIVRAMENNHIPVIYALYQNEGHGFIEPANRLSFHAITEQFLAYVLKGRAEPIQNDFKGAEFLLNGKKNVSGKEAEEVIRKSVDR